MAKRNDDCADRLGERIGQVCADLRTTQEAYRDLVENINDVIFTTDADGTLTFVSPQVRQYLGFDPRELAGRRLADLVHPDDLPIVQQAFANVMGGELRPSDFRILAKSGQYHWIRTSSRPVVRDGRVVGISGVAVDVHERKLAEETLRLHSVILENMAEGTMLVRASDQTIAHANPAFERMFGYGPGEMVGMQVSLLNAPGESSRRAVTREIIAVLEATGRWQGILRNVRKDGSTFWCSATVSTFDHPLHGRVWVAVHSDVTEQKKAEEELQTQQAKLRALTARLETAVVRERQQIAADLHDQVGQVLGLARLEISTIAPPRSQPEQLATWRNARRHIDQAIRFTRTLSAELHPPVLQQLGIGPALRWLARETSGKAGIPVSCRIVGPAAGLDGGTASYIYHAAQELVRNAVRHARPGRISITFRRDARTVRLRVRDDGAGFDASRVDRPAPARSFGLFSLRERTAAMGGSFALDTAPGKGTSVEITVPVPPS